MFEWILIALVVAAIFYASDLPKIKKFLTDKFYAIAHKAVENKKTESKKEDK